MRVGSRFDFFNVATTAQGNCHLTKATCLGTVKTLCNREVNAVRTKPMRGHPLRDAAYWCMGCLTAYDRLELT